MTEVFVSYSSQDRERAAAVVTGFEQRGLNVWWDRDLTGGDKFREEIDQLLEEVPCVVVLWSKAAKASRYVPDEMSAAADRNVLIPVHLDDAPAQLGTRELHWESLRGWKGRHASPDFQSLVTAVNAMLGRPRDKPLHPAQVPWAAIGLLVCAPIVWSASITLSPPGIDIDLSAELEGLSFRTSLPWELFPGGQRLDDLALTELNGVARPQPPWGMAASRATLYPTGDEIRGGVDLQPLGIPPGTFVGLDGTDEGEWLVDLEGPGASGTFGVGTVETRADLRLEAGGMDGDTTFLVPAGQRLSFEASPDLLRATMFGRDVVVAANIPIDSIRLARFSDVSDVDDRLDPSPVRGQIVLGADSIDVHPLASNERIRMEGVRGELRLITIDSENELTINLAGTASRVVSVAQDGERELLSELIGAPMPAYVRYRRGAFLAWLALYGSVVIGCIAYWWTRPIPWWMRSPS